MGKKDIKQKEKLTKNKQRIVMHHLENILVQQQNKLNIKQKKKDIKHKEKQIKKKQRMIMHHLVIEYLLVQMQLLKVQKNLLKVERRNMKERELKMHKCLSNNIVPGNVIIT